MARSPRVVAIAIALFAAACATSLPLDRDHATLVAAERAFARHAQAVASIHPLALEPAAGGIATSVDLAYTYGAWRSANANGHYVHLWARDAHDAWKIAVALRL